VFMHVVRAFRVAPRWGRGLYPPTTRLNIVMLGIDKGMIAVTINQGYLVNYQLPIDKIKKELYSERLDRPEPIIMAFGERFEFV
jgi:hypothetical protein